MNEVSESIADSERLRLGTHGDVSVADDAEHARQAADEERSVRLNHHVGRGADRHAARQGRVLHVDLRAAKRVGCWVFFVLKIDLGETVSSLTHPSLTERHPTHHSCTSLTPPTSYRLASHPHTHHAPNLSPHLPFTNPRLNNVPCRVCCRATRGRTRRRRRGSRRRARGTC